MRKLFCFFFTLSFTISVSSQKDWQFGLQTGATLSKFDVDVNIRNAFAATIPPINEFSYTSNFQFGAWLEKRVAPFLAIRWELQRSPGGTKAYDVLENREKRYKLFYLSSPLLLKFTSFQKQLRFPVQLELGVMANLFLFDYGEDVAFGEINRLQYSTILGLSKNINEKWGLNLRYIRGLNPFSTFDVGGVQVNWNNQMYAISVERFLFSIGKEKKAVSKSKKAKLKKKKAIAKKKKRRKQRKKK